MKATEKRPNRSMRRKASTFQELIMALDRFWADQGCLIAQPYDMEMGAGTFHPLTFFKALGPDPWRVAFVQPSRRPTDGRYADNPLRAQRYYQYQVILKPAPSHVQALYLTSLRALGIDLDEHDVRFVQDDWESPTLGAWGLGWEVWLDGLEVTQFTYFQQMGGIDLEVISAELTYGLERIAMFLQDHLDLYALRWNEEVTYGQIHRQDEVEGSCYNFERSDIELQRRYFKEAFDQAERLLRDGLLLPAYEQLLKTSHAFNLLDARGAVGASERPTLIAAVRTLAKQCAQAYLKRIQHDDAQQAK
jgi:glycyl-tRNA synthetase alpha chain